ncbi:hypothetical protein EON66_11245, partial [archaeon]
MQNSGKAYRGNPCNVRTLFASQRAGDVCNPLVCQQRTLYNVVMAVPTRTDPDKALWDAVAAGDGPEVDRLVRKGANKEAIGEGGATPLHAACVKGHVACVRVLLDLGAKINATNSIHSTPLHEAVSKGHAEIVRVLLDAGARTDIVNTAGHDAMHRAIAMNQAALAHTILQRKRVTRFTPAHEAALGQGGRGSSIVLTRASAEAVDGGSFTPLHVAAAVGNISIVNELLRAGANMEATTTVTQTPLYLACSNGHEACVRLLLDEGANKEATNKSGATPLYIACLEGHEA